MKKFFLTLFLPFLPLAASAADFSYVDEVKSLGYVSGQGLACEASKYDTFEMLARAILITKAKSDTMQEEGMRAYNEAKVASFVAKIKDGFYQCPSIAVSFNNQKIFKTVLYGDGTIKMPDGKMFTPRTPYDATLVYEKDPEFRNRMIKEYTENQNKILHDPAYKKALRERQQRVGL